MKLRIAAGILIALLSFSVSADPPKATEKEVEHLIKELGADSFKVRRAAKKKLEGLGYIARRVLLRYKDSKDPELRENVAELLEKLRWQLIPGAGNEVRDLISELENGDNGEAQWEAIAKVDVLSVVDLVLEIHEKPKLRSRVNYGIFEFLKWAQPRKAAKHINGLNEKQRKLFISLLDQTNMNSYRFKLEQMLLFHSLGDHKRVLSRGLEAWQVQDSSLIIDICTLSVVRGELAPKLWESAGQQIYKELAPDKRCLKMSFYCSIASKLRRPHVISGLLRIDRLGGCSAASLDRLLRVLEQENMEKAVDLLLNGRQDPWLMYRMLERFNQQLQMEMGEADWKKVMTAAKTHESLYRLAEKLTEVNMDAAIRVLKVILDTEPAASRFDMMAHSVLSSILEERGQFAEAAKHLEEARKLALQGRRGAESRFTKDMKVHASEIAALDGSGSPLYTSLMTSAISAELRKDYKVAISLYRKAIDNRPKLPFAYKRLYGIYRDKDMYDGYNDVVSKMIKTPPPTTRDLLTWSHRAADVLQTELAQKYLDSYLKQSPFGRDKDKKVWGTGGTYAQALIYNRQGKLKQALETFEPLRDNRRYPSIHRQFALIYLKLGRFSEAEESLHEHLVYNPFDEYARIWLHLALVRDGKKDTGIDTFIKERLLPEGAWSTKILRYYEGKLNEEGLLASASAEKDEAKRKAHLCEGYFYIAERALVDGNKQKAIEFLNKTTAQNILLFIEHVWAIHELKNLDP